VWLSAPGKVVGAWVDYATNQKGDILDLISLCEGLDRGATFNWARKFLAFEELPTAHVAAVCAQRELVIAAAARDAATDTAKRQKQAFATYLAGKKTKFVGSLADTYLQTRGIDVSALSRVPGVLGFVADGRHTETNTSWPVMIAGFGDDRGIKAIHRTFLTRDGQGKAPVDPPRKIWPSYRGLTIRLWRGETEMPPEEAASHGLIDTLCLCEGVEDGLSVALARPDLRVWAAGSLGNLAEITVPVCSDRVIVCADNDWGKPQAEKALQRALQALIAQGRPVSVARAPGQAKDFNDVLKAEVFAANNAASLHASF
jgi:hypothetical protein